MPKKLDTLSPKSQETAGRNNGGRGIREGAAGTESMVTAGVVNIDPEIRAARAAQRARWRREQGLPPDDPEPLDDLLLQPGWPRCTKEGRTRADIGPPTPKRSTAYVPQYGWPRRAVGEARSTHQCWSRNRCAHSRAVGL